MAAQTQITPPAVKYIPRRKTPSSPWFRSEAQGPELLKPPSLTSKSPEKPQRCLHKAPGNTEVGTIGRISRPVRETTLKDEAILSQVSVLLETVCGSVLVFLYSTQVSAIQVCGNTLPNHPALNIEASFIEPL